MCYVLYVCIWKEGRKEESSCIWLSIGMCVYALIHLFFVIVCIVSTKWLLFAFDILFSNSSFLCASCTVCIMTVTNTFWLACFLIQFCANSSWLVDKYFLFFIFDYVYCVFIAVWLCDIEHFDVCDSLWAKLCCGRALSNIPAFMCVYVYVCTLCMPSSNW